MAAPIVAEVGPIGGQARCVQQLSSPDACSCMRVWHSAVLVMALLVTISYRKWYQFGKTALEKLAEAEAGLFATAGAQLLSRFIPVGTTFCNMQCNFQINFKNSHIYTVTQTAATEKANEPIVLVHGFGAGVAIWSRSIVELARYHTVHAIDILGTLLYHIAD